MTENEIRERVRILLPDSVIDVAGTGKAYKLQVISSRFAGKSPQTRQQPIKALFSGDLFTGRIGSLSIRAYTPDENPFAEELDDALWQAG